MGMKEDFKSAVAYAKSGDYKQARKLIAPYKGKHPKIDAFIATLDKQHSPTQQTIIIGIVTIVLVCFVVTMVMMANGKTPLEQSASSLCEWANGKGANCNPDSLIREHSDEMEICLIELGTAYDFNAESWHDCLLIFNVNVFMDDE